MAAMSVSGRSLTLAWAAALALAGPAAGADDDERLSAQVEKIDAKFQKAFGTLAQEYDKAKDPEAAHFFAECALGFGLKDQKIGTCTVNPAHPGSMPWTPIARHPARVDARPL